MTATRRLAAILAADAAGYSRLIGAALQALKALDWPAVARGDRRVNQLGLTAYSWS